MLLRFRLQQHGAPAHSRAAVRCRASHRRDVAQLPLGEEDGVEDADFAEEEPADDDYFRLGEQDEQFRDYASLALKDDHANRCACADAASASWAGL